MRKMSCLFLLMPLLPGSTLAGVDVLRNDAISGLTPRTPLLSTIFTGGTSACSADLTVTLDAADPADCTSRVEGEGSMRGLPGSDDGDDLYAVAVDFATAWLDPDAGVLAYPTRKLVLWQLDGAGANDLRLVSDPSSASVWMSRAPSGACCRGWTTCDLGLTRASCDSTGGIYAGDGTTNCDLCVGSCCTDIGGCYEYWGGCLSPLDFWQFKYRCTPTTRYCCTTTSCSQRGRCDFAPCPLWVDDCATQCP